VVVQGYEEHMFKVCCHVKIGEAHAYTREYQKTTDPDWVRFSTNWSLLVSDDILMLTYILNVFDRHAGATQYHLRLEGDDLLHGQRALRRDR
jgi:hypothetical protein